MDNFFEPLRDFGRDGGHIVNVEPLQSIGELPLACVVAIHDEIDAGPSAYDHDLLPKMDRIILVGAPVPPPLEALCDLGRECRVLLIMCESAFAEWAKACGHSGVPTMRASGRVFAERPAALN